jgi:hypothetical protein
MIGLSGAKAVTVAETNCTCSNGKQLVPGTVCRSGKLTVSRSAKRSQYRASAVRIDLDKFLKFNVAS